ALFCNIKAENVITAKDVSNIYEVPLVFYEQGLDEKICQRLNLKAKSRGLDKWAKVSQILTSPKNGTVEIGIVGKYVDLTESYKSVSEALVHGAIANQVKVNLKYIDSERLESSDVESELSGLSGILVPGGFGNRGVEGKIKAIQYARSHKIPYFGICIGLQLAVIEYARHVCGLNKATSREFSNTGEFVIDLMEDQRRVDRLGGSMRLGSYRCKLASKTLAHETYGATEIWERHRHRYELNNHYRKILTENGLVFSGINTEMDLVEMMEIKDHPWFLTCQFHPEFKSKPFAPHPLFVGFVKASLKSKLQLKKPTKKETAKTSSVTSSKNMKKGNQGAKHGLRSHV
ncbi:MAG: CTP synthase, partial [Deltaproteobacteria bacterium]